MQVLVAEPEAALRAALCVWMGHLQGGKLAGVARNNREILPALRTSQADLALLDWDLIMGQAAQVVAEARHLSPVPLLIVLSARPETAQEAARCGIDLFLDKRMLPGALYELLAALRGRAGSSDDSMLGKSGDAVT